MDWLIGALCLVAVLLVSESDWMRSLEHGAYDLAVQLAPARPPSAEVVVVAIDEASLAEHGAWPWSRDLLALAQRRITAGEPRVVAYTLSFEAAHNERGLEVMAEFRDRHAARLGRQLRRQLQQAVNRLDTDHSLSIAFRGAGQVLLGFPYDPAPGNRPLPAPGSAVAARLEAQALPGAASPLRVAGLPAFLQPPGIERAGRVYLPTEKIAAGALGIAPSGVPGADAVRAVPLVVEHAGNWLPTLALRVYAAFRGVPLASLALNPRGLAVNGEPLTRDLGARVHPRFYPATAAGDSPFTTVPIAALIEDRVSPAVLRDKIVLVGLTAPRFAAAWPTPLGTELSEIEVLAHTVSALLGGDAFALGDTALMARLAALVLIGCYLMLLAPRLRTGSSVLLGGLLTVLVVNVELFALLLRDTWVPMMNVVVLLVAGHLLLAANRLVQRRLGHYQAALSDSNRLLGQALQAQGRLDEAFAKFRHCLDSEETAGLLYNLGLDFERKRHFNKAGDVFRFLHERRRRYRDVEARIARNDELDARVVLGPAGGADTLIIAGGEVQKPVLGRYELERELGRGAMGMVYLGRDPKIGRTVAVKTMALDQEFDAENLDDVKQRFFREAETAGRLKHPHIVTIYDVGEERDLSYIAMDYLPGEPLSAFVGGQRALAPAEVLEVAIQVAEALHYAHQNNVVHRDIKPGNIILDETGRHATVTDFGVACLTDASRTKTGTILGSPSFMSPEQLSGERVDGRSDLFSLGVTLFQLLTAQLPFTADSLSSLMYRIANERHPDPCKLRPGLPACVRAIVDRALQKAPERRYGNGEQMAIALRRCRERMLNAEGKAA